MSRDDGKLKAKAQLRAEAVERLRNCYYTSDSDLMRAMLNWGHEPHTGDDSRFALIGLLTDEEPRKFGVTAEQMAKASTDFFDKFPSINGKKADSLQDSREKLEAEIRYEYNGSISNEAEQIIEWLDRQAAITRTECERFCETCRDEQVDELQHELETRIEQSIGLDTANKHLKDENARLRSCMSDDAEYGRLVMGAYRELRAKLDEIAKVVDA